MGAMGRNVDNFLRTMWITFCQRHEKVRLCASGMRNRFLPQLVPYPVDKLCIMWKTLEKQEGGKGAFTQFPRRNFFNER
jgi:hypothetical protein